MVPTEFEKELKKRLRSREALPGEDAWDRIAARLDAQGPAPRNRSRWWAGLAAASIALLVSLLFLWDRPDPLPVAEPVVEAPREQGPATEPPRETPPTDYPTGTGQGRLQDTMAPERPRILESPKTSMAVAYHSDAAGQGSAPHESAAPPEGTGPTDLFLDRRVDTVPESMAAVHNTSGPALDAELDSLLREARKYIAARDTTEAGPAVDPSVLLAQAEDELDQTFREQMIQKLREGYKRMRQAVAARKQ